MSHPLGHLYIEGQWMPAENGKTWPLVNPATEAWIQDVAYGDGVDAAKAIHAAQKVFPSWSHSSGYARADLLKKTAQHIRTHTESYAQEMILETGKPYVEAVGEWTVAANLFEWYGEESKRNYGRVIPASRPDKRMQVIHQPLGVVGIITAWNFPAYNPARAVSAALAAGCTLVIKGSEYTPLSSMNLVKSLEAAGFPPGVVNLVHGEAAPIGAAFLNSSAVRKISFTGSTRVGKLLMQGASATHTRLSLELGGNAPVIVTQHVRVEAVAKAAVFARFRNCGQVCVAPQRFYVAESIFQEFSTAVISHTQSLKIGRGAAPETQLGPLINSRQRQSILELIEQAVGEGGRLETGGKIPTAYPKGYFMEPAVFTGIDQASILTKKEIFGPVLPLIPFQDLDQAIGWANETEYGLAAYAFTDSLEESIELGEELQFGIIGINEWAAHGTEAPFGGWKQSGQGHESGMEGMLEYMETKLISTGSINVYHERS